MFCKKCGSQIPEGVKFCAKCGTAAELPKPQPVIPVAPAVPQETVAFSPVSETPVAPVADSAAAESTPAQTPAQSATTQYNTGYIPTPPPPPPVYNDMDEEPKKEKSPVALIVTISCILVILLGALFFALWFMNQDDGDSDRKDRERSSQQQSSEGQGTGNKQPAGSGDVTAPVTEETMDETQPTEETEPEQVTISKSNMFIDDYYDAASYVLDGTDTRFFSRAELTGMTRNQLYLAQQEIYARYGCTFPDNGDLDEFFRAKSWYTPDSPASNFNKSRFSETERVNLLLLQALIMERDGTTGSNRYISQNSHVEGWIMNFTDSSRIKKSDVEYLSETELVIAYSEIYARKGYIFDDDELQLYFSSKNWYAPTKLPGSFNATTELNEIERENYECLKLCEQKKKGVRFSSDNKYEDYYYAYSEYMCSNSDTKKISPFTLADMNEDQLLIARNEIYARHGYAFSGAKLNEYFMHCSWYYPTVVTEKLELIDLSDTEEYNMKMIQAFELNLKMRKGEGTVNTKMSYYAKHDFMTMYLPEHWRLHCVCEKPTGLSGNLEFYEKYNEVEGYGWIFNMELVPTSRSVPSYYDADVEIYGYVTTPGGEEYYVLKVTPRYREDMYLEKIYELMLTEVDTIFDSIEWKSGYTFRKA